MVTSSNPPPVTVSSGHQGALGDVNPADVSRYVADICGELSKMTKSARLLMLSYLLAMARQEAERIARDTEGVK